jgi:hypothetical protein
MVRWITNSRLRTAGVMGLASGLFRDSGHHRPGHGAPQSHRHYRNASLRLSGRPPVGHCYSYKIIARLRSTLEDTAAGQKVLYKGSGNRLAPLSRSEENQECRSGGLITTTLRY